MKKITILIITGFIFTLFLTACSDDGKELYGAWKSKTIGLAGMQHTIVFDKGKIDIDGNSIVIKITKKADVFFISRPVGDNEPFLEITPKDNNTIFVKSFVLDGDYIKTTVKDVEDIRKQPPRPIPDDPF